MAYTKAAAGLITTKEKCKIPEANDISLESLHNAGVKASLAPRLCKKLTKSLMPLLLLLVALLFPTFLLPPFTPLRPKLMISFGSAIAPKSPEWCLLSKRIHAKAFASSFRHYAP